jgi:hypothetical protein
MLTSVHIPKPVLDALDQRARALQISKNRLAVRAIERELAQGGDWAPGFFERLASVSANADEVVRVPGLVLEDWSKGSPTS